MAKKTRKVRQQESTQRAIRQALNNTQAGSIAPVTALAPTMNNRPFGVKAAPLDPAEEYKYVRSDLKRIGLLAVSFTAILVVLSFFIK
jgi:hypothetical protein